MDRLSETLPLTPGLIDQLKRTEQNPRYHAEGNVYNHTVLVLQKYRELHHEFDLSKADHEVLYWTCILHDLGKIRRTRWFENRWRAKGHEQAGVPMAREILLKRPEVSAAQRRRIIDLVRYHSIPLQWGLRRESISAYKRLATLTDLRLLGIFSYFDVQGRLCVQKEQVLGIIRHFIERITPQVDYELGSHQALLTTYQQAGLQHKNALWHALKLEDISLLEKLLKAQPESQIQPACEVIMTLAAPGSEKTVYLDQHYPGYARFNLDQIDLGLSYKTPHQRESQLRQVKHFISVYAQAKRNMVINGHLLSEDARRYIMNVARQYGSRVSYLFFDERLDALLRSSENEQALAATRQAYDHLLEPHPWESHAFEVIDATVLTLAKH